MTRDTLNTSIVATVPVAVLALAMAFFANFAPSHPGSAQRTLDREAVAAIAREAVREEIADAGLGDEALEARMEEAIIAFIRSRAREPGNAGATPQDTTAPTQAVDVEPIDPAAEPVAGSADARYQLIVYSDYECPFCKRFDATLKTVIARYGERLAVTLRDYPLPFHGEAAMREAVAAQCVFELGGNEAFWSYSHGLFGRTASNGSGLPEGGLMTLAGETGVDEQAFERCLADAEAIRAGIEADQASGNAAGVRGTPTSVLLDTRTGRTALIRGAQPLSAVTSALDNLLGD